MSRDDIDKKIDELMKKCNKAAGGYACDKQSAYQNGFRDGLREALAFIEKKTVEVDYEECPHDLIITQMMTDDSVIKVCASCGEEF